MMVMKNKKNIIIIKKDRVIFQEFLGLKDTFYLCFYGDDFLIANEPAVGSSHIIEIHKDDKNEVTDENEVRILKAYTEEGEWIVDAKKSHFYFSE